MVPAVTWVPGVLGGSWQHGGGNRRDVELRRLSPSRCHIAPVTGLDPRPVPEAVVWLASRASDGQTDQRIVAKEFAASPPA